MIKWIEKHTGWFILVVLGVAFIAPRILTIKTDIEWLHFTDPVGDTIGGITAPILNFAGIILLYLTLKKQNSDFTNQREYELISKQIDNIHSNFEKLKYTVASQTYTASEAVHNVGYSLQQGRSKISIVEISEISSFLNSFETIKQKVLRILNKNINSSLSFDEKKLFFDELVPIFTSLIMGNSAILKYLYSLYPIESLREEEKTIRELILLIADNNLEKKYISLNPVNNRKIK